METMNEVWARLSRETTEAYRASPYSAISADFFARFSRDPQATPHSGEVAIDNGWKILLPDDAPQVARLMADHLADFLKRPMQTPLPAQPQPRAALTQAPAKTVLLLDRGGGDPAVAESFTITVEPTRITVAGRDPAGLRDGIVKLVDFMGFRQAPIVPLGTQVYRPRLPVRLGETPYLGSHRDTVFLGYNTANLPGGELFAISDSDAIPELAARRDPSVLQAIVEKANEARRYGLKTYSRLTTRQKFPKDDPVLAAHPDIRGTVTWKADGEYILCTEHPLVQRYLEESIATLMRAVPDLSGICIIIGGEGFYHCFMRAFGAEKGHTNCPRCEKLGPDTVVANLCNRLAAAARKFNPNMEVIAWPYSAEHVWAVDPIHRGFIEKLRPGAGIFTEIEKDEYITTPDGIRKHLWDYSIHLIGPGERARQQVAACKKAGVPIYMKSEPELGFEAPRLPHLPCMDLWVDRAEALVSCGADGAWVFPAFRPLYGTSAAELNKHFWWQPVPDKEELLNRFAARIAGEQAAKHVRAAWRHTSDAIQFSPELPSYYIGPYYLGPAQPMIADPNAKVPDEFFGKLLFYSELTDEEGLRDRPVFETASKPHFIAPYRHMRERLEKAAAEMDAAEPLVAERHRLMFNSEASAVRWFYRTARAAANFYESARLRDELLAMADRPDGASVANARKLFSQWEAVLRDEKENAVAALPVAQADVRLDFYYGGDHTLKHTVDMLRAKTKLIDSEINDLLPRLQREYEAAAQAA